MPGEDWPRGQEKWGSCGRGSGSPKPVRAFLGQEEPCRGVRGGVTGSNVFLRWVRGSCTKIDQRRAHALWTGMTVGRGSHSVRRGVHASPTCEDSDSVRQGRGC